MDLSLPERPLNPRQERFCHYFVLYACASVAAIEAGYSPPSSKHQGYRLLRSGRVRERIRALHAEHCRDLGGGDTEALIGKLENVYRRAVQDHHFHTAARCIELQARLASMKKRRDALPALPLPALPTLPTSLAPPPRDNKMDSLAAIKAEADAVIERMPIPSPASSQRQ